MAKLILQPRMSALRVARGLAPEDLRQICEHEAPLPIEELHLRRGSANQVLEFLRGCRSLPRLRILDLRQVTTQPEALAGLEALREGLPVLLE